MQGVGVAPKSGPPRSGLEVVPHSPWCFFQICNRGRMQWLPLVHRTYLLPRYPGRGPSVHFSVGSRRLSASHPEPSPLPDPSSSINNGAILRRAFRGAPPGASLGNGWHLLNRVTLSALLCLGDELHNRHGYQVLPTLCRYHVVSSNCFPTGLQSVPLGRSNTAVGPW